MGLSVSSRTLLNATANGALMRKTEDAAFELLEELALNNDHGPAERQIRRHNVNSVDTDAVQTLTTQVANLTRQLQNGCLSMNSGQTASVLCIWGQGPHPSEPCQVGNAMKTESMPMDQANFVGNFNRQQNNPYSDSYNPSWKNHPNFSWNNTHNAMPTQRAPQPHREKKVDLEKMMAKMAEHTNNFMAETKIALQN